MKFAKRQSTSILVTALILTCGCASQSAMPLGNDMMQIDVSTPAIFTRARAQQMAFEKAAKATLAAGYDKFIILGNQSWTDSVASGGSQNSFNASNYRASGGGNSSWNIYRRPEVNMVIKMFHYGEEGSEKAIDALSIFPQKTTLQ